MIPPIWMILRVNSLRLWLPLFLLWPIYPLIALFSVLIGLLFLKPIRLSLGFYQLLCALRGLRIEIKQPDQFVKIYIH